MVAISQEVFRAYDIRGIVNQQLDCSFFQLLGRAYGSEMQAQKLQTIVVGYDGRQTSEEFAAALITGLKQTGLTIASIGRVPTPCLYYAVSHLNMDGGIMITGSHNPPQYNGCKMMMANKTLALDEIQILYQRMRERQFTNGDGKSEDIDFLPTYLSALTKSVQLKKSHKLVLDCGNGVAGICASPLFRKLGVNLTELYCEVDGNFPNHHPDPSNPANLVDLQAEINKHKADLGYAFDGDGDRLGLVDNKGQIIFPDRLLMLFAEDLLSRHTGATIIYDVKCSFLLPQHIHKHNGNPLMWKTGHSLIKRKMKETGALLGGEMSGHIFFAENWCGSDDAFLAAVRLLQILDDSNLTLEELFARYPQTFSTPEINIPLKSEKEKFTIIERLSKEVDFKTKNISTIDGLRAEYDNGWGLVRASNTSPVLVLRFEAEDEETLQDIKSIFHKQLHRISPRLELQF